MSNQDIQGNGPPGVPSGAPEGTPAYFEQQLAKELEAKALMRDRLRHTEALAAESHALRSRMAQELERVTADRDRLRTAAAGAPAPGAGTSKASAAAPAMTPRISDWPLDPPPPPASAPRRSGPWRALAMLGSLAAAVGALAWFTGSLPGETSVAANAARDAGAPAGASASAAVASSFHAPAPAASTVLAGAAPAFPLPSGAVALPPVALTPEAQLAASPSAAGPAVVPPAAPAGLAGRLRKALDGEGIASPVDVDAATGHVMVADPQSDDALRDRTDMLIRAVYAGASLPEPQIEHRWLSPRRGERPTPVAQAEPPPAAAQKLAGTTTEDKAAASPAAAYAARHATFERPGDRHRKTANTTVADAEELRPVLPEGRVTASCRASFAGKSAPHRADMTACMRQSCCSSANGQAEDCRAYGKAYPFTCSAG